MGKIEALRDMERLLCNRKRNEDIFLLPCGKQLRVVAEMEDSIHHMRIDMVVNQPSLRINMIDCEMVAIPDTLCRNAQDFLAPLVGRRIIPGFMGELKQMAHKCCTHLLNLFHDACYDLTMAQGVLCKEQLDAMFPSLTEAQIYNFFLWFRPELRNSCILYAEKSSFMQAVSKVKMPIGMRKLRALTAKMGKPHK